jgi:hypothetical protein
MHFPSLVKCAMVITNNERHLTSSAPKEAIYSFPPETSKSTGDIRELGKILPSPG